jgi:hypothetical protein
VEDQGAGVAEARLSPRLAEAILSLEFFEVTSNFARDVAAAAAVVATLVVRRSPALSTH